LKYYKPGGFKYRPDIETAKKWFEDGQHLWNTGYFMTTPDFIMSKYEKSKPEMTELLYEIKSSIGTEKESDVLQEIYPQLESIHFDHIVFDYLKDDEAMVVEGNLGWYDPGTLYALKQFLQEKKEDNVCKGQVYNFETKDSLVYNYVNKQLVTTIGLEGFVVVNTPDAVLVCHKNDVGKIKEMLKEFKGTELEKLL
jgi:mannose-1-phosphate guanylyltransferase